VLFVMLSWAFAQLGTVDAVGEVLADRIGM
jgi:hypothetical protein